MKLWAVLPLGSVMTSDAEQAGEQEQPSGVIVLLDYEVPNQATVRTLDDDLCWTAVQTLLDQVDPILRNHRRAHAQRTAELVSTRRGSNPAADRSDQPRRLDGRADPVPRTAEEVLLRAADLLRKTTHCDAALVYSEGPKGMEVCGTSPRMKQMIGMRPSQRSLTLQSIERQEAIQIVETIDTDDPNYDDIDFKALEEIQQTLGWDGVASWICYPVTHEGTCVGLIKLMTRAGGRLLGHCQVAVLRAVADRAAQEMRQITELLMLDTLNKQSNQLAGKEGEELVEALTQRLERWCHRFIRPGCQVAVVSSVTSDEPEVFTASAGITEEQGAALQRRSGKLEDKEDLWRDQEGGHGIAAPMRVPGSEHPRGHLFVLGAERFRTVDQLAAQEAAREFAVLLDQQRRRLEWAQKVALFRHAVLGPVQGLSSAALMLHQLLVTAGYEGKDEEREGKLGGLVLKESEALRLWRVNQRLYTKGREDVEPRNHSLKAVVDRCVQRFQAVLAARGIAFFLDWRPKGSVDFSFDPDALDLVLSNLLDNARKYSFFNQEVTLVVKVDERWVHIRVEDVGHPIPRELGDTIYQVGKRLTWKDPIRTIDGSGLGLAMVVTLLKAHGGQITHTSQRLGRPQVDGIPPHYVKFIIKLPHGWKKRR